MHLSRVGAEPPPETTTLRLSGRRRSGVTCQAAMYVVEELLRGEGFTDVQCVEAADTIEAYKALATGDVDFGMGFAAPLILHVDAGDAIVFLAGGHVGCFELFGSDWVRALRDLKGKTVAVPGLGSPQHIYLATIVPYIGLDPRQDITWVTHPSPEAMRLFSEGTLDAFLGFSTQALELRAKQIGHVLVNSMTDRPWSHYFCCMPVGNREFIRQHPNATKRWLRAFLKAMAVELMEAMLTGEGFRVLKAYGGQEGIALARREVPALIVLDLLMPEVDGFTVVELVRGLLPGRNSGLMGQAGGIQDLKGKSDGD